MKAIKLKCVIQKESVVPKGQFAQVQRVPQHMAERMVASGNWAYTTKGKYKAYLNDIIEKIPEHKPGRHHRHYERSHNHKATSGRNHIFVPERKLFNRVIKEKANPDIRKPNNKIKLVPIEYPIKASKTIRVLTHKKVRKVIGRVFNYTLNGVNVYKDIIETITVPDKTIREINQGDIIDYRKPKLKKHFVESHREQEYNIISRPSYVSKRHKVKTKSNRRTFNNFLSEEQYKKRQLKRDAHN